MTSNIIRKIQPIRATRKFLSAGSLNSFRETRPTLRAADLRPGAEMNQSKVVARIEEICKEFDSRVEVIGVTIARLELAKALAETEAAQQSVHLTGGTLPVELDLSTLEKLLVPEADTNPPASR
jgi:hypothetical protein